MKNILRILRNSYLIIKEAFTHPNCYSEINLITGEITRYKEDPYILVRKDDPRL